jgi:hypothetical protein
VRILVVDTYYPAFLASHYGAHPELAAAPYAQQHATLMARHFGTGEAYSRELDALGHWAHTVIANCAPLQVAWARENGSARMARAAAVLPTRVGYSARDHLPQRILLAQIAQLNPEVVYLQDLWFLNRALLEQLRSESRLVVGQIASEPPSPDVLGKFDLLVTSLPHLHERFQELGIDSLFLPLAFDGAVLDALRVDGIATDPGAARPHLLTCVGALNPRTHGKGTRLLEALCRHGAPLEVWGYGADLLEPDSPLLERWQGAAFGLDMYRVLAESQITINRHIDIAGGYANNMRLYEATGVGALLATEEAPNLANLFHQGKEVIEYRGADDLLHHIERLLTHDERRAMAAAAQARTLRQHTYAQRIATLVDALASHLR